MPNERFTKESSIGEFLTYYLGEELVQNQIAPVLAGVYSGDLNQLSIASTLPYLIDYKTITVVLLKVSMQTGNNL